MDTITINDDKSLVAGIVGDNLSRVAVYASLQSFNDINHDSSRDLKPPANTKSSVSSSTSLLSFYSDLSTIHHRTAPRLDGKNTSARPLSLNDISARLSQRAITFTSKYYNNNNSNSENTAIKKKKKKSKKDNPDHETAVSSSYNVSSTQMKRKRQNLIQRINFTVTINNNNQYDNDYEMIQLEQCNLNFILQLNREWNVYIKNLLQLDNVVDISDTLTTKRNVLDEKANHNNNNNDNNHNNTNEKVMGKLHRRIMTFQNNNCIEWVGAFVHIRSHDISSNSSSTNITLKQNQTVRNNNTVMNDIPVEPEMQQQRYHKQQKKVNGANAMTETAATTTTSRMEGILISHSPNSWMIVPIIMATEASDTIINNNNNINHNDVDNNDVKIKADNTSQRTSTITATITSDVIANATVNDSCVVQTQNQQKKQDGGTAILLLPKVKIPKQQTVVNEASIVITACIPLDNSAFSFMDWYMRSTTTLMNDETQFLNIHLQSR